MNAREVLKKLIDDLDEETAKRILKEWNRIVSSFENAARVYFDGSAAPNPGVMRIGAVVEYGGKVVRISKEMGIGTNNEAEYLALIEALKVARKMGARAVEIFGDSSLVIEQIRGRWRVKNPRMKELKSQVMDLLGRFDRWNVEWIPDDENPAHELAHP